MVSFSSIAFIAFAYISCLVNASPLAVRDPLDVASPPVTYPTKGVVWTVGQTQTVTWDTSNLPAQITNPTGKVVLGWIDGSGGYNLQLKSPLASGFPITAGKVDIVVPAGYPDGDSYIIALLGSSDNVSPTFTITSGGGSPTTSTANPPTTPPTPSTQTTPVPATQPTPSTTPGSGSSVQNNVVPPSSTPSNNPPSVSSSSSSSSSSPSASPSGTSENSNSSTSSSNAAWVNKPVSTMVVSLLAGAMVTLFF